MELGRDVNHHVSAALVLVPGQEDVRDTSGENLNEREDVPAEMSDLS